MSRISLIADTGTLRTRQGGPANGQIWLEINHSQFPMHGWDDFVVVVMSWWAASMLRLLRGSRKERVHFMDGPYTVEITKLHGQLQFRALEGAYRSKEVAVGEISAGTFIAQMNAEARAVLAACKSQGWWSNDAEQLKGSIEALEFSGY
jgi:hypothetical protein